MRKICYIILFVPLLFLWVCCTSTKHYNSNRAFVPLPIPVNLKCYCYVDDLHLNIQDSIFFNHYYQNVNLKDWREFETIDLVSEMHVLQRYTIGASEQFRTINRRISRLFIDEVIENKEYRVVLEYYLNNKRINSMKDAFKLATLDTSLIDNVVINISELRDTCRVNIILK